MKKPTIREEFIMVIAAIVSVIAFTILTIYMSGKNKVNDVDGLSEMQDFHESRVKADYPNENVTIILFGDED